MFWVLSAAVYVFVCCEQSTEWTSIDDCLRRGVRFVTSVCMSIENTTGRSLKHQSGVSAVLTQPSKGRWWCRRGSWPTSASQTQPINTHSASNASDSFTTVVTTHILLHRKAQTDLKNHPAVRSTIRKKTLRKVHVAIKKKSKSVWNLRPSPRQSGLSLLWAVFVLRRQTREH